LVLAGIVAEDFYKGIIRPQASTQEVYCIYNIALISAASVGVLVAWQESSTIMALVRYAWAGLGAAYGPLMLVSLYSHYPNKYGALAGIIVGAAVSAVWDCINPYVTAVPVYAIVPAYIASFCAIYGVTAISKVLAPRVSQG
jgi:sodium/proline symporter